MKKLEVPKFQTEAEEAKWWDEHMNIAEANLVEAIKAGTVHKGGPRRVIQERRESKNITIRVALAEMKPCSEKQVLRCASLGSAPLG